VAEGDPLVSIISLTYNRREKIGHLLQALHKQSYRPLELIVIDNASSDGTGAFVRQQFPSVRLLSMPDNQGMVAYNAGLQAAQGEYILVMDDDGLPVGEDWVEQVVSCFRADPRLGVVCCKIQMLDTGQTARDNPLFVAVGGPEKGYPAAAYNGTGAGIRAEALHKAGYYPTYFFRSWLESHLCTRILDAGWEVRYFPRIPVWHDRASGSVTRTMTYYGVRNYYWYLWSLCPGPGQVTLDTLHYLGILSNRILTGRVAASLALWATRDAFLGSDHARRERQPVSAEVWRYLQGIRGRRNRIPAAQVGELSHDA
jgi:GT2 family glycosyltransferase